MTLRSISVLILSLIAVLNNYTCFGQRNMVIIKGSVIEINSSLPLPFSSISILNSPWGTVSNEAGNFELNIPPDRANDTLRVSFIGYATRLVPISELNKQNAKIELTKETRILEEVTVIDKKPDAKKIVTKALKKIRQNYISRRHHMEAFYREQVFDATKKSYNSLECVVNIDDPGIRRTDSLVKIQIKEMRKGVEYLPGIERDSLLKSSVNRIFLGHNSYNNIYWIYGKNAVRTHGYQHRYDR